MTLNKKNNNADTQPGSLYVVATPIGNKQDITIRAINILKEVDYVAAEDTRHTGRFFSHYGIKTKLISLYEHNEEKRSLQIVNFIKTGLSVALVSSAGTPTVSDPGYRLLKAVIENNIKTIPVPGASAAITALCVAGLPTDSFTFIGFCSRKKEKRIKQLEKLSKETKTLVFYESAKRITNLLYEINNIMGERYCVLCREMTKYHEEIIRDSSSNMLSLLKIRGNIKGECTLCVMGGGNNKEESMKKAIDVISTEMDKGKIRFSDLVKQTAKKYDLKKSKVYAAALKLQNKK